MNIENSDSAQDQVKPSMPDLIDQYWEGVPVIRVNPEKVLADLDAWVKEMDPRLDVEYERDYHPASPRDCDYTTYTISVILKSPVQEEESQTIAQFSILASITDSFSDESNRRAWHIPVALSKEEVESAVRVGLEKLMQRRKTMRLFEMEEKRRGKKGVQLTRVLVEGYNEG
jgi:hypothetical protein